MLKKLIEFSKTQKIKEKEISNIQEYAMQIEHLHKQNNNVLDLKNISRRGLFKLFGKMALSSLTDKADSLEKYDRYTNDLNMSHEQARNVIQEHLQFGEVSHDFQKLTKNLLDLSFVDTELLSKYQEQILEGEVLEISLLELNFKLLITFVYYQVDFNVDFKLYNIDYQLSNRTSSKRIKW